MQVAVHTDGLNECLSVDDTLAVLAGRTIHAFHIEGCGGGHVPDVLRLLGVPNVIGSSTNPTLPFGRDALAEHDGDDLRRPRPARRLPGRPPDARDRIRAGTMGAEDVLHDLGVIAITSSDAQGMGRAGETVRRTFQLAAKMRAERGPDGDDDNERVLRYLAKLHHQPGASRTACRTRSARSTPGKLADIVLWAPAQFGAKPELVLKAGFPAWGVVGDPNADDRLLRAAVPRAAVRRVRRRRGRPVGGVRLEGLAGDRRTRSALPTRKRRSAVSGCRRIGAADMVRNDRLGSRPRRSRSRTP